MCGELVIFWWVFYLSGHSGTHWLWPGGPCCQMIHDIYITFGLWGPATEEQSHNKKYVVCSAQLLSMIINCWRSCPAFVGRNKQPQTIIHLDVTESERNCNLSWSRKAISHTRKNKEQFTNNDFDSDCVMVAKEVVLCLSRGNYPAVVPQHNGLG